MLLFCRYYGLRGHRVTRPISITTVLWRAAGRTGKRLTSRRAVRSVGSVRGGALGGEGGGVQVQRQGGQIALVTGQLSLVKRGRQGRANPFDRPGPARHDGGERTERTRQPDGQTPPRCVSPGIMGPRRSVPAAPAGQQAQHYGRPAASSACPACPAAGQNFDSRQSCAGWWWRWCFGGALRGHTPRAVARGSGARPSSARAWRGGTRAASTRK